MNEYIRSDKLYSVSRFFCYIKHVLKGGEIKMVAKSKISQGIKNLQNNLGFTRDEAIKISCDNITKSFQKNLIPALIELQERIRYSSAYLDNLYHQENECRSRWYQGVKNTASQNIKMKTLIKLSTAFEMSPGELMDYIIDFDKKKK